MRKPDIDKWNGAKLREKLDKGEAVLWEGVAEPFRLTEGKRREGTLRRWCVAGAVFLVLTAAYVLAVMNSPTSFNWVVEVILLAVCGFAALQPALDASKLCGKVSFYLTDRRAAVVCDGREAFTLDKSAGAEFVDEGDGCVTVLWGSAAGVKPGRRVVESISPRKDSADGSANTGLVFYHVRDSEALREACR